MIRRTLVLAGLALALAGISTAQASISIRLTDLGTNNSITVGDGAGNDSNSAANAVTFIGALGSWNLNVSTGISTSGQAALPLLDLNSISTSSSAGSLKIELTDTNFAGGLSPASLFANIGGNTRGSVLAKAWVDPSNTAFGHGGNSIVLGTFFPTTFSASAQFGPGNLNGPFSITEEIIICQRYVGTTAFDFETRVSFPQTTAVPEPAMLAIWSALGSLGVGLVAWKKSR